MMDNNKKTLAFFDMKNIKYKKYETKKNKIGVCYVIQQEKSIKKPI